MLKQKLFMAAMVATSLMMAGCRDNPMKGYVEQTVDLKVAATRDGASASGTLTFEQITYTHGFETVCDYYECGGYRRECTTHQVCVPIDTPVCRTDENGQQHCSGGPTRQSCHTEVGACYDRYVSRSCRTNCREEARTYRHSAPVKSKVEVAIKGAGDLSKIGNLALGVKTTSKFIAAFDDATQRPENFGYLWDSLTKADRTVLVLKAKGLQLVKGQDFLNLPTDFRRGDTVKLELQVEPSGSLEKDSVTAAGSPEDFPSLEF